MTLAIIRRQLLKQCTSTPGGTSLLLSPSSTPSPRRKKKYISTSTRPHLELHHSTRTHPTNYTTRHKTLDHSFSTHTKPKQRAYKTPRRPTTTFQTMLPFKGFFQQFIGTPAAAGTCGDSDSDIYPTVRLPPVGVVDVEQLHEKRDRAVRHLVKLNHLHHSVLYGGYNGSKFHNHIPHVSLGVGV